jgi:type III pantothenate kinase
MSHMLAVDIGNTNITIGLFKGKHAARKVKIPTFSYSLYEKHLKRILKECGIKADDVGHAAISSVVPIALARFIVSLNRSVKCNIRIIGRDVEAPIKNMYQEKKEVGQDRLVNAYAARALYGHPAVVIDFGTAITFDVISKEGDYLGGLILPGIEMGLQSLHKQTALLPKVELKPAKHLIGTDTESSMQGGILFGYGAMCDGLVEKYRNMLGKDMKVVATGGNAGLIKQYSESIDIVDEDLTLKGLNLITASNS